MKTHTPKLMRCSKSNSRREVYSYKCIHQENRKISNKETNFIPQGTTHRRTKPKFSKRKEIIMIRTEMN